MGTMEKVKEFVGRSMPFPQIGFLLLRLNVAGFWAWGFLVKGPWNDYGCGSFLGSFCVRDYLTYGVYPHLPAGLQPLFQSVVLGNLMAVENLQFLIEGVLFFTLLLGILTRGFALIATLWAALIAVTLLFIPNAVLPDTTLFLLSNFLLLIAIQPSVFTLDRHLRPRLERSRNPMARFLLKWMY